MGWRPAKAPAANCELWVARPAMGLAPPPPLGGCPLPPGAPSALLLFGPERPPPVGREFWVKRLGARACGEQPWGRFRTDQKYRHDVAGILSQTLGRPSVRRAALGGRFRTDQKYRHDVAGV